MLFPIFLDLTGRPALVVGNGQAAAVKAALLQRAGARVRVVADKPAPPVAALADGAKVTLDRRPFMAMDVTGMALVIAAAGDARRDREVAAAAEAAGVPVNVVDTPSLSTFVMPAIVDRDPIVVAVSSGGIAPALARQVRARIEAILPARLGHLARFAERFRGAVKATRPAGRARRWLWERVFSGPVADLVLRGEETKAREQMLALVNTIGEHSSSPLDGRVQMVGAGPGDPDLLTLKALQALQQADAIVHDRLVNGAILDYARRDAERFDVGKAPGGGGLGQDQINALLVRLAREGKRVVRLKGGDPSLFGRGGEEIEHLRRHDIAVEVVPGVTAATAASAALGMPLTHRDRAQAVTLVTGRVRDGGREPDWAALARGGQTLVVYMGAATAGLTRTQLLRHGLDPATPVAVVAHATWLDQRIVSGCLRELPALVATAGPGPLVMIIGEVAGAASAATAVATQPRRAAG